MELEDLGAQEPKKLSELESKLRKKLKIITSQLGDDRPKKKQRLEQKVKPAEAKEIAVNVEKASV